MSNGFPGFQADRNENAGGRWIANGGPRSLADKTLRHYNPRTREWVAGYDVWFCDFNNVYDFTVSPPNGYPFAPSSTPTADPRPDPSAPNVNNTEDAYQWARIDIGSPVTLGLKSNRGAGSGGNVLVSSASIISGADNTGYHFYNPFSGFGVSGDNDVEMGAYWRARNAGAVPFQFFGLDQSIIATGTTPITSAGAFSTAADQTYVGFRIDANRQVHIGINNKNVLKVEYATGITVSNVSFNEYEMRGVLGFNAGGQWARGYIDLFVNGVHVLRPTGNKFNTFVPSDMNNVFPMSPQMHAGFTYVRQGGATAELLIDAIGSWHTRESTRQ